MYIFLGSKNTLLGLGNNSTWFGLENNNTWLGLGGKNTLLGLGNKNTWFGLLGYYTQPFFSIFWSRSAVTLQKNDWSVTIQERHRLG